MADFFQQAPTLGNQYTQDKLLRSYLRAILPKEIFLEIEPDLKRFGERVITDIATMGEEANLCRPELVSYDPWGNRTDQIRISPSWEKLKAVSAKEGLVSIGYERNYYSYSRLYQFAKLYLFHPSSAVYTCPLAMSDGAARLIEVYGDDRMKARAYAHLISREPSQVWTSGQWMTEKMGGSDLSRTQTIASLDEEGYRLYGHKWFTSATTSEMAMTLARLEDPDGKIQAGSQGLSLFYLELRDCKGDLNNIRIQNLKNKLGTEALPTAELDLVGTKSELVGGAEDGVKKMATLFNITRIYNSICAIGGMRRGIALAQNYATVREAFGHKLKDLPLHIETLTRLQVEFEGCFHLVFHMVELLGKEECQTAKDLEKDLLRLLIPVTKLYTAKQGIRIASEIVESFGGVGYIEETGIPRLLREAQVLSIWEGTTNVLSLDVLRAMGRNDGLKAYSKSVKHRLEYVIDRRLIKDVVKVEKALHEIIRFSQKAVTEDVEFAQAMARGFAFSLARVYIASLLLEYAQMMAKDYADLRPSIVAKRWCQQNLTFLFCPDEKYRNDNLAILRNFEDC